MGRYMKKCKGLAEIAVVDLAERELGKRIREDGDGELDLASAYVELRSTRRRLLVEATASVSLLDAPVVESLEEANCPFELSPLCSGDVDRVEDHGTISDPEGHLKSAQLETVTFYGGGRATSSNPSPAKESNYMEANPRSRSTVHEMPSEFEIEEFFTKSEQDLHKRFSEKYNFDAKKGVPLEGRYEWVPVHHEWS